MTRLDQVAALNITPEEHREAAKACMWLIPASSGPKNWHGSWTWDTKTFGFIETREGKEYCLHMFPPELIVTEIRKQVAMHQECLSIAELFGKSLAQQRNLIIENFNATQKGEP